MFNEAFKPSRIKAIDPRVETLAYELIDEFLAAGKCDWVRQFCVPLPLFIIGEQMGAAREDMWRIKGWTDAFFHRISLMLPEDKHLEMVDREIEAQHYFQPIFERLRAEPDGSLISVLVNTVIEGWGRPLNDEELHAEMMADTFVGGETTAQGDTVGGMSLPRTAADELADQLTAESAETIVLAPGDNTATTIFAADDNAKAKAAALLAGIFGE